MITGIIAEFNPLHTGHKYLLDQIDGLKIVAMSGNFVQRGEPAIVDKWTRTQMALEAGADLVVELPFLVSVQSADYFAKGAIDILAKLGAEQVAFGSELEVDYNQVAHFYAERQQEMEAFRVQLPAALSYPQQTAQMWKHFLGIDFSGNQPNHVLALAYAKAVAGRNMTLKAIKRQGAGFHSEEQAVTYASATALRKHIDDQNFIQQFAVGAALLQAAPKVTWADYFPLLRYQILSHPDLTQVYQVNEELAVRIRQGAEQAESLEDLLDAVVTKRYTRARIRRILLYMLCQVREADLPAGIHVLGFSPAGRAHLSKIKSQVDLVVRIGRTAWDPVTQSCDRIFSLGNKNIPEQNYGRMPLTKEEGECYDQSSN